MGAAFGAYEDGKIIKGSANDLGALSKVPDAAAQFAIAGAGAALFLHFVGPSQAFRAHPIVRTFARPDRRVTMMQRGERLGVNIA